MKSIPTIIIGAGQCGLAMSRELAERSVDHLVLERGEVANAWTRDRWDSLTLLTPNWMSRLPGQADNGADPDGFMAAAELAGTLRRHATASGTPVQTGTEVLRVTPTDPGYLVETNHGPYRCQALVMASGACNIASVPATASELPASVHSEDSMTYKRPGQLPEGGVLVVGGSATGIQLAREIRASGRPVILSVGEHIRVPRTYRGRDIKWWMEATGTLDERFDEVDDLNRVRRAPSLQLVGTADRTTLDLNALMDAGVDVVGKLSMIRDGKALFSGSLANHCALSDQKMNRLLDAIDEYADEQGLAGEVGPAERFAPTRVAIVPRLDLDLTSGEIRSVVWATGYRADYSWLEMPVLDYKGRLRHDGGVVDAPGLFAMGLTFMRRRKSTLIAGAGPDAADLAPLILPHLTTRAA